jgi:hypothetical protein
MGKKGCRFGWLVVLASSALAGCSGEAPNRSGPQGGSSPDAEAEVRAKFAEVQSASKSQDPNKLWDLLSGRSQADADKEAKGIRAAYRQGSPEQRGKQEKEWGLPGGELAKLTGARFLETRVFRHKRDEVAGGKVTRVRAEGDSATVYFDDPEGDKEKLRFVREDGQWKAWMTIPKVKKP